MRERASEARGPQPCFREPCGEGKNTPASCCAFRFDDGSQTAAQYNLWQANEVANPKSPRRADQRRTQDEEVSDRFQRNLLDCASRLFFYREIAPDSDRIT